MFRKILVCLDGSSLAEQVLPYATEVAQRFGSRVVLLQVIHLPASFAAAAAQGGEKILAEEVGRLAGEARAYLEGVAAPLREKGLEVEAAALEGTPSEAIVTYARENEVDLIAIGTHGRKSLGRLIFGSVADHVLKHSSIPVLTVKPQDKQA